MIRRGDALAEYLLDNCDTADTAFDLADTGPEADMRLQNPVFRDGSALDAAVEAFVLARSDHPYTPAAKVQKWRGDPNEFAPQVDPHQPVEPSEKPPWP